MKRYALIFIILVTTVLGIRTYFQGEGLYYNWQKENFWLKKANSQEAYNLIVLGDSRVYYAVNPDILKSQASDHVFNFAFSSISFTEHYLQRADELIVPGGKVLIGLTAEALTNFEADQGLTSYENASPLFIQQLTKIIRVYWPVINLQTMIMSGKIPLFQLPPQVGSDIFHSNGQVESKLEPTSNHNSMIIGYHSLFQRHKVQEKILKNLEHQAKLWAKKGVTVYAFWICFEKLVCSEEDLVLGNGVKENINLRLANSGVKILPYTDKRFLTFDGDHLTGKEARRYSELLKSQINESEIEPVRPHQD